MKDTEISYVHHTANFWWGCMKVSPGCKNCFAETLAHRYGKDNLWGPNSDREVKKGVWDDILKWDKEAGAAGERRRVFIETMGDFLEDNPLISRPRTRAMDIITHLRHLDVLIVTKRPENYFLLNGWLHNFPPHVWMITSVENQEMADWRIPQLLNIPCKFHGLSVEPMLGPIDITGDHRWRKDSAPIDWVICGGESGPRYRTMDISWAQALREQCREFKVPFYMKQDSGLNPGMQGRIPDELWSCKELPLIQGGLL